MRTLQVFPRFRTRPSFGLFSRGPSLLAPGIRRAFASALASSPEASPWPDLPPGLRPAATPPSPPASLPRRILRAALRAILLAHLCFAAATSLLILAYRFSDPSATVLMAYRAWSYGWELEAPRPLPLGRVPTWLRSMLISVEDGKFYRHFGVDFEAFRNARAINERLGRTLYGGSTLTMQVARTLFLVPEKSYLRKYLEVIVALELELFLPKDRILELYFGYAEWGRGVFGIEAAARRHYGKGLSRLTREEAARLVALLSSPIRFTPATLGRSAILRERFAYLERRYLRPPVELPPGGGTAGAAGEGAAGLGAAAAGEAPPPAAIPAPEEEAGPEGQPDGSAAPRPAPGP